MSIASEITRINTNIANSYTAVDNKNGTLPQVQNSANLASAIDSIEVIEPQTAEGESLSLANTKAMPYSDYVVEGKSEQETRSGKNLFNKDTSVNTTGYITSYTYSNGIYTIIPTGTGNPQIRLNVSIPQGTYTLNSNNYLSIATILRNNNGLLFSFENNYENQTFTINESSSELVFNWANPNNTNPIILDLNTLQIEQGSTATSYEPYGASPSPDYPSEIHSVADDVNLFDKGNYTITYGGAIGFDVSNLEIGEQYTFSSNLPITYFKISDYSSGYNSVSNYDKNGFTNFTFTMARNSNIPSSETQYLFIALNLSNFITDISDITNYNIKVQKGSISTPYSPYNQGTVTIKQRGTIESNDFILQIEPLRSLPNGVKDTIETDGIHRRVGRHILLEIATLSSGTTFGTQCQYAFYSLSNSKTGGRNYNFISNIIAPANEIYGQYKGYRNSTNIVVMTSTDDTVENFNSKISGSEVLYELATEVIEPLTQNQATTMLDIIKTGSYEGTTNIYTDEDVKPTIKADYYKKK